MKIVQELIILVLALLSLSVFSEPRSVLDEEMQREELRRQLVLRDKVRLGVGENGEGYQATNREIKKYNQLARERANRHRNDLNHPCGLPHFVHENSCIFADLRIPEPNRDWLNAEEIEFLFSLKAYIKAMIKMQQIEAQTMINCLNEDSLSNLKPLMRFRTSGVAESAVNCLEFRTKEVPALFEKYKLMKVYLALSQAKPNYHPPGGNILYNPATTNHVSKNIRWGINENVSGIWCDVYRHPLNYRGTDLCMDKIEYLFNPYPRHTGATFNWTVINEYFEDLGVFPDLPDIVKLEPLTFQEINLAAALYRDAFVAGARNSRIYGGIGQNQFIDRETKEGRFELNQRNYLKSLSAGILRGETSHLEVFRETMPLPQDAYTNYQETLTRWPFLAFVDPPINQIDDICEHDDRDASADELCSSTWKRELDFHQIPYQEYAVLARDAEGNLTNEPWRMALKRALETTIEVNQQLLAKIDERFDSKKLMSEISSNSGVDEETVNSAQHWMPLLGFNQALQKFKEDFPEFNDGRDQRLLSLFETSRNVKFIAELTIATGFGIGCAAFFSVIKFAPPICLYLGGLGVNAYYYTVGYDAYQDRFLEYFASPKRQLTLIDLELVDQADEAMLYEAIFAFVGTGLGDVIKRTNRIFRSYLNNYSQKLRLSHSLLNKQGPSQ